MNLFGFLKPFFLVFVRPREVLSSQRRKPHVLAGISIIVFLNLIISTINFFNPVGIEWNLIASILAFIMYLGEYVLAVVIIYGLGRVLGGKGRFSEILWCISLIYATFTAAEIVKTLIGYLLGSIFGVNSITIIVTALLSLLLIPLFIWALYISYLLIRVIHETSRIRSIVVLTTSLIAQIIVNLIFQGIILLFIDPQSAVNTIADSIS